MKFKKIGLIAFYLQTIIFLVLGITLVIDTSKTVNILTNNQLLGLIIILYILILNKRQIYRDDKKCTKKWKK